MKRLSILITIFLLSSIGFVNIILAGDSQTLTVVYQKFNSATATEYNLAEINATWQLKLFENVTWGSNSEGNITIYDLDDTTVYIVLSINGTHIHMTDENEVSLYSATAYTEYVYLNSYATYLKLKTDNATTWVTKSHDNFGINKFNVTGNPTNATAGNCKLTFSTGAGVIDITLIEQIIPVIVTMAVITMVVKMLSKMTAKMTKL